MKKQVYISADYSEDDGDRAVVDVLKGWAEDKLHKVDFIDMAEAKSGSVTDDPDCRACDLKLEFNKQINASSAVIIIVGDKTASRKAGSNCSRCENEQDECSCTPYKKNADGSKDCKVRFIRETSPEEDFGEVNPYSYIQHEFEQAKKKNKQIVVVYNAERKEPNWMPSYMTGYEDVAVPFWLNKEQGEGDYEMIKEALGYD